MQPRVSVVMPCYNGAAHLAQSVGSVLAQTMPEWELLLIDDGSTDGSGILIDDLARKDPRIRAFHQANAGLVATRNRGLAEATGEFIGFLDADDSWHPDFAREMIDALDTCLDAGIAYCGWQNIGLGGGRDKPYVPPDYENLGKAEVLLKMCPWPVHGALVRRPLFERTGGFDGSFNSCEDYDLWLRLGIVARLVRVPRVLAYYHHHGGEQMTRNRARIALNHLRAQRKFLDGQDALIAQLGTRRVRELTFGGLLHRGYVAYWKRDLPAARTIFREVMRHGYGGLRDWLYMVPAWLPESWHRTLLERRDSAPAA